MKFKTFKSLGILIPFLPIISVVSCGNSKSFITKEELLNLYPERIKTNRTLKVHQVKKEFEKSLESNEINQWNIFGIKPIPKKYNLELYFQVINWDPTEIMTSIMFMRNKKSLIIDGKGVAKIITIYGYKEFGP